MAVNIPKLTPAGYSVLCALVADAFSLQYHWVYNDADLPSDPSSINSLGDPHSPWQKNIGRTRGNFTHYGDQFRILLEQQSSDDWNNRAVFAKKWKHLFTSQYAGYVDKASKDTLEKLKDDDFKADGSTSGDFSVIGRLSPLLLRAPNDRETVAELFVDFAKVTHNNPAIISIARYFASVVHLVLSSDIEPKLALENSIATLGSSETDQEIRKLAQQGLDSVSQDTRTAIANFGKACSYNGALPSTVHVIAKYDDLNEALQQNLSAGGDNAARASVIGMVLGAHLKNKALDSISHWIQEVDHLSHDVEIIAKL